MSSGTVVCVECGYSEEFESVSIDENGLSDEEMNAGEPPQCPVCGAQDWDYE